MCKDKVVHFSIDDVNRSLRYIYRNNPNSIFDLTLYGTLQRWHEQYGLKVSMYCISQMDDFNIASVPIRYSGDFSGNKDWLRFGFHSSNSNPFIQDDDYERGFDNVYENISKVKNMMVSTSDISPKLGLVHYYLKDLNLIIGKRVIIYGAGAVGKSYYLQFCTENKCHVIGIADKNYQNINWQGVHIFDPSNIVREEFDYVILALNTKKIANDVRKELIDMNIPEKKILWFEPQI